MDKLLNDKAAKHGHEMRKGIVIDIEAYLGTLDTLYLADLDASISSFNDYEAISAETYNDYKIVCAKLEILNLAGYLDDEELNAMRKTAAEMRLKKLEGLEHENGE